MLRGRPRKVQVSNRDPSIAIRDPQPMERDPQTVASAPPTIVEAVQQKPRLYIPASMPTVCPKDGHSTRVDGSRYIDPAHHRIVEYRSCVKCGLRLGAGREMTKTEVEKYCTHEAAVADYQKTL